MPQADFFAFLPFLEMFFSNLSLFEARKALACSAIIALMAASSNSGSKGNPVFRASFLRVVYYFFWESYANSDTERVGISVWSSSSDQMPRYCSNSETKELYSRFWTHICNLREFGRETSNAICNFFGFFESSVYRSNDGQPKLSCSGFKLVFAKVVKSVTNSAISMVVELKFVSHNNASRP